MSDYGVIAKKVGPDCCIPGSCQGIIDLVAGNIEVENIKGDQIIGIKHIYYGSKPAEPDGVWINGNDGYLYVPEFSESVWKRSYWPPAGSSMPFMWSGSEQELWNFDGAQPSNGANNSDPVLEGSVGPYAGSFWKVDKEFEGRSPIGVGYIGGDQLGTRLAVPLTNFGFEKHKLIPDELPIHTHKGIVPIRQDLDPVNVAYGGGNSVIDANAEYETPPAGKDLPHNTVHPVRTVYIVIRTGRRWYTIPF